MPAAKSRKRKSAKASSGLTFNHAMLYVREIAPALHFYADLLGFKVIEEFKHDGRSLYARLRSPKGNATLALHVLEPGKTMPEGEGVRLYFEASNLKKICADLRAAGVKVDEPKMMPWGWMHTYLDDPDGHEVSLYWAGAKRFRKSKM